MLKVPQILVRVIVLVAGAAALAGCGQKGSLVIPTEVAARQRAPLIQTLRPAWARTRDETPARPPVDASGRALPAPVIIAPPTPTELVPESTLQE
ncbi:hypothetical protein GN316_20755 [Xylophilus sp. Kf1]|nr:hypothetical protein [Xylophilus sp. Kf1]